MSLRDNASFTRQILPGGVQVSKERAISGRHVRGIQSARLSSYVQPTRKSLGATVVGR